MMYFRQMLVSSRSQARLSYSLFCFQVVYFPLTLKFGLRTPRLANLYGVFGTLMIRRLKKDVLSELPVKRRQQVFLDLAEKDLRQIKALFLELGVLKDRIKLSKAKDEHESLKLSEKSLINKVHFCCISASMRTTW
ncbi:uncharacterized protein LOC125491959 isoform X2 [Beta vulgaris subsp. vulgaris]|nr:uncharacterized protein LOC125491959 isoform X2 [Beta vulgaris subsp. vulgaris]